MVRRFSRSNEIGEIPAALLNRIFSMAWVQSVLALFGLNRRRRITDQRRDPILQIELDYLAELQLQQQQEQQYPLCIFYFGGW